MIENVRWQELVATERANSLAYQRKGDRQFASSYFEQFDKATREVLAETPDAHGAMNVLAQALDILINATNLEAIRAEALCDRENTTLAMSLSQCSRRLELAVLRGKGRGHPARPPP